LASKTSLRILYSDLRYRLCYKVTYHLIMASVRKNKSDVWEHFEKLSSTKVKCKLCLKELSASGGVTSSMHGHLRSKHRSVAELQGKDSTPMMMAFVKQRAVYKRSSNLIQILAVEVRI